MTTVGVGLARVVCGCADGDDTTALPSVGIIGGGVAGLHCAYRLKQAGLSVTVFEASSRVGGRMYSARGKFPDKQVVELGGELIDTNHRFMRALVKELKLKLDDRLKGVEPGYVADTWFVNGAVVPEETIVEQFTKVAPLMLADMEAADEDDAVFEMTDNTPLSDWLDDRVPSAKYPELHSLLISAYRGEFGRECSEQSALNLIYLIGSDEPSPFRVFGESDERYHIHGGNDLMTSALGELLPDEVVLDRQL